MDAFHGVSHGVGLFGAQSVRHMHALDDEHSFVVLHFTPNFATEAAFLGVDFARIQRAGKGAQLSAPKCRDDIIDGRCVRLGQASLVDAVMLRNPAMNAEHHGL